MPSLTAVSPRASTTPASAGTRRSLLALALALVMALFLLVPALEILPGLHGDEAWAGYRAYRIAVEGMRPLYGMNFYTGPLHQYILAAVLGTFGYTVSALRSPTVAASLVSVVLFFFVVRRVFGGRVASIATLLLVSLPFFAIYGRIATENFVINPPAALGAAFCLLKARDATGRGKLGWGFGAGLLLAIGAWTHLIFLPVVIVLALLALAIHRLALLRSRTFHGVALGFLVGLGPRLYQMLAGVTVAREFGLGTQASGSREILAEIKKLHRRARRRVAVHLRPGAATAICCFCATPARSCGPRRPSTRRCSSRPRRSCWWAPGPGSRIAARRWRCSRRCRSWSV
jgi:hypothetical protein